MAGRRERWTKRILLIVPFTAGGSNDTLARAVGQKLADAMDIESWRTIRTE